MRPYYDYSDYERKYSLAMGGRVTPGVKWLLVANVGVFVVQYFSRHSGLFEMWFALTPVLVVKKFMVWQIFTYMFLHGSFFHIFINMFVLYMFGGEVERAMRTKGFLRFYFITGIVAGLTGFIFAYNHSMVGASGAIFAVLAAFATFYPNTIVLFMFIFPMKAKHMVLLIGGIALLATLSGGRGNIAHFAHLGGLAAGILYLHYGRLRSRFHFSGSDYFRRRKEEREWQIRQEVDRLLDKVHREGMGSLTKKEQKFLKEASRRFRSGE